MEFVSFGYHNVRGLPNPKLRRACKHLADKDPELQQKNLDTARGRQTYAQFERWLDAHVASARIAGLWLLWLCVGCKSGQHHSVPVVPRCCALRAEDGTAAV